jgi:hypothetical protein
MVAGSSLTLVGDGGPGTGEASFASITAVHGATINGSVTVKGNVEVGNSVGTLNVNGNYTVGDGSTYKWETGAVSSDLIAATGAVDASANWNLQIKPLSHNAAMNGAVLISGGAPAAVPGTVTVTMADNVYSDLFNVSSASAVNSGNNVVLAGVVTASHTVSNGGAWNDNNAWTEGTGNTPTAGDVAVVAGGNVTASSGGSASNLTLAGGNLSVTSGTLAVSNNVRIGNGSELTVDGAATQVTFGNETKVYSGGTLHLKDGGSTNLNKPIDVLAGGTLKTTGTQTLQENVQFDAAANLHVASGALSVVGGGSIPTGLQAWFDASQGVTANGSNQVTSWTDLSGNGHHATLQNGTPVMSVNQLNGLPVVQFRGNDDFLNVAGTLFSKEQYVVVRSPNANWSEHGAFLGRQSGRDSNYLTQHGQTGFHGNQYPDAVSRNGVVINPTGPLAPITDWMLLKIDVNNNNPSLASYWLGRGDYSGVEFDLAEILAFNRVLTAEEENDLGGYLADKYGLTTTYTGGLGIKLGNVHVASGATLLNTGTSELEIQQLSGSGTVNSDVLIGSLLSPGNSIGTLDIDGNLTMDVGTVYDWEMDSAILGDYDSVEVAGTLEFEGDWLLKLLDDGINEEIFASDKFYLFTGLDFTGGDLGTWSIDGSLVGSGWDYSGAMIGGDANGVYLTGLIVAATAEDGPSAVPEPSTYALAILGLLSLGFFVLRKKYRRA